VVWQFRSYAHSDRVRLTCRVAGSDAWVPSCCDLWPGANFSEREAWDMFGVRFEGHPDLRRLLMPDGYEHHPLRKDFPHQGIEPDRLYRQWDRERRERWQAEQEEAGA
jgi:NADH-quinone oxidoreductase subunit C